MTNADAAGPSSWLAAALLATVVSSALCGAAVAADASRFDVPISQLVLPNGDTRYSVPVSVGGGPSIDAALDTGSFGLRVLSRALTPGQYEATDQQRHYAFGGGARFNGVLANGVIAVGQAKVDTPMLFQLVQSVDCTEQKPKCPAARLKAQDYGIAGSGFAGRGYDAILGVSMRKAQSVAAADNPLAAMGTGRWIVMLPRLGQSAPGHLIINPDESEVAGFALFRLQRQAGGSRVPGWKDAALAGCVTNESSKERICGETLLDSGAPGFSVNSSDASRATAWPEGTEVKLQLQGGDKPVEIAFKIGQDAASKVRVMPGKGPSASLSAGSLPYRFFAVLYDQNNGIMGMKPRDDSER